MISVAIDGPAGAGKSTIARKLAQILKATYIDTGAMYRALTLKALDHHIPLDDEEALVKLLENSRIELIQNKHQQKVYLDRADTTDAIRSPKVTQNVSAVAKHPRVRAIMVNQQRAMAEKDSVVMDGRDIGTDVLPKASVKIFLTASVEERARRRYEEQLHSGYTPSFEQIKRDIILRDQLDSQREASPLKKAEDAIEIDTTSLTIDEVVDKILGICKMASSGKMI